METKNVVYLSYGNENEYRRAIFSICSLLTWYEAQPTRIRLIIYTDNPSFFQTYFSSRDDIEYFFLSEGMMSQMRGNHQFFHRIKVSVIDLTFKNYPDNDMVFVDSDTFFITHPKILFEKFEVDKSFMHTREYKLSESVDRFAVFNQEQYPKAFINFIDDREFLIGERLEKFGIDDYSWNSGVLGLHSKFSLYMPSVLDLTDQFYANSKWFISEQMAFSLILQHKTLIKPCDNLIFHYWGARQKLLMDVLIKNTLHQLITSSFVLNKRCIRSLTKKCRRIVEADLLLDQIRISILNRSYYYGLKKISQLILKDPKHFIPLLYTEIQSVNAKKSV